MKEENRRFIGNKGHVVVVYDSFGVLVSCDDFMTSRTTTIQPIDFAQPFLVSVMADVASRKTRIIKPNFQWEI